MALKWKRYLDYRLGSGPSGAAYEIRKGDDGYLLQVFLLGAPVKFRVFPTEAEAKAYAERIEIHGPFDYVLGDGF